MDSATRPRGSAASYPPIAEKLVARLWDDQRPFVLPLATTDGEEVQVVYRGRRRWDRGPDFVGALIARAGAALCHGDVEIHVRSSDWRAHGHRRDRNYNRVILQVVMWHDSAEPTLREDGVRVPVVALASHLAQPLETLLLATEEERPRPSPCWPGRLEDATALGCILDRCGMERLAAKTACFESDLTCSSPDQLLYQGIAVALGYSQNRDPFRRLAGLVPLDMLLAHRTQHAALSTQRSAQSWVESLLLGAAGLLPFQRGLPPGGDDPHVRALEEGWGEGISWVGEPMRAEEWEFFRVRPANFPTRRVAALAAVVDGWPRDGLARSLAKLVGLSEPKALPRVLETLLLGGAGGSNPNSYWAHHCDFGLGLRRPGNLIGRQRAAEIVVNVFLPFLAAWAAHTSDEWLERRVREVYRLYPKRGDNEIARYVATQVTTFPQPRVARSACRQQGLLHIYWGHCETKRCGECPVQDGAA